MPQTSSERVVVVADAHVGGPGADGSDQALLDFLAAVPGLGDHLLINGDLFDFWFEYKRVVPRTVFPWLAALADVKRRGISITMTGGNHDRWGGAFWREQLGARFEPNGFEGELAGLTAYVHHGDGLSEQRWRGALMHRLTRNPLAVGMFRMIHPDFGFWLVDRLYGSVREHDLNDAQYERLLASQCAYARGAMERRSDLDLVVLSHVHRPHLTRLEERRWFLNPGPWQDRRCYALIGPEGPELKVWGA